jgi:hypothetical protein
MRWTALAICIASAFFFTPRIHAQDVLGVYVGAAAGQSRVDAQAPQYTPYEFSEHHSAFKVMAGIRALSFLGAEIEYVDLGHPNGTSNSITDASIKGAAAYGVLYLPMGLPSLDLFGEGGVARLETTVNGAFVGYACTFEPCTFPNLFHLSRTDTHVAGGVGVQYRLGPIGIRGEYERFDTSNANPTMLSLGLTWTFL